MRKVFITTGNGMFGRAVVNELLNREDVQMRIMVRDRSKISISSPNAEIVTGDLDKPETFESYLEGMESVFLTTPIDDFITTREIAVADAAAKYGVKQIVKIAGAVRHENDDLAKLHGKVLDHLKNLNIPVTLVSPNSVMETSLMNYVPAIKYMRSIFGMSGHGKIGLVALKDIAILSAHVLTTPGHEGINYELTGPEAIDLYEVAETFSKVLGVKITYYDLGEENFSKMMMKFDKTMTPQKLELEVLCHLRAWREGRADLVTDTFEKITGKRPTSLEDFIKENYNLFRKNMAPSIIATIMRKMV